MANSAFSPSVLTLPSTGGTGQGELNLVTNPSAVVDTNTSWTPVGLTVSRLASGSPLDPIVPTGFQLSSTAASQTFTAGPLAVPSSLQNRKLKVELWYKQVSGSGYKLDVSSSSTFATRYPLTTDSGSPGVTNIPATAGTTGKFTTYFDADSSGSIYVRLSSLGTGVIQFTQVVVGPGIQPQGAVVGEWQSYTPTLTSGGTTSTNTGRWRRVGSTMEIETYAVFTSAGSAGSFYIGMPAGYTVATRAATFSAGVGTAGTAIWYNGTGFNNLNVDVTATNLFEFTTPGSGTNFAGSSLANGHQFGIKVAVPIAEWAGSGTVQLAQNDVEFAASTSGTWDAPASAAQTVYGPAGATITGALTVTRTKVVQFNSPIQPGDKLTLEYQYASGGPWTDATLTNVPFTNMATVAFGGYINAYPATNQVQVSFQQYAVSGSVFNTTTGATPWGTAGTPVAWRVRKSSAGAAVGFGIVQPGTSSGLVSSLGLPGKTDGTAVTSGYVGEVQSTSSTTAWTTGNTTVATLPLTAGRWLVSAYSQLAADTTNRYLRAWVNTSASVPSPQENKAPYNAYGISPGIGSVIISNALFDIPTGGGNIQLTVTTSSISGLTASYHFLNAVRIA